MNKVQNESVHVWYVGCLVCVFEVVGQTTATVWHGLKWNLLNMISIKWKSSSCHIFLCSLFYRLPSYLHLDMSCKDMLLSSACSNTSFLFEEKVNTNNFNNYNNFILYIYLVIMCVHKLFCLGFRGIHAITLGDISVSTLVVFFSRRVETVRRCLLN